MFNSLQAALVKAGLVSFTKLNTKSGWNTKLSYRTFKKLESEGYTKFQG